MVSLMFPMIDGEQCPITPSPKMKHLPETIEWGWFEGDGINKLPFLVYTKFILPISDKIVMGGIFFPCFHQQHLGFVCQEWW
jgi:hypothetical protein